MKHCSLVDLHMGNSARVFCFTFNPNWMFLIAVQIDQAICMFPELSNGIWHAHISDRVAGEDNVRDSFMYIVMVMYGQANVREILAGKWVAWNVWQRDRRKSVIIIGWVVQKGRGHRSKQINADQQIRSMLRDWTKYSHTSIYEPIHTDCINLAIK